jgi:hypothetical protein
MSALLRTSIGNSGRVFTRSRIAVKPRPHLTTGTGIANLQPATNVKCHRLLWVILDLPTTGRRGTHHRGPANDEAQNHLYTLQLFFSHTHLNKARPTIQNK